MTCITFGELMLRLNPQGYMRFLQADSFQATYAGAEANVAVSIAQYGGEVAFVSKIPAHEMGQAAINSLRRFGVDTSKIIRGGDRLGLYYVEKGTDRRPGKVIYDRAHSAFADAKPEDFDWEQIFTGADWFHFSGVTPALSESIAAICLTACREAHARGIRISCDVNYRAKLWTVDRASEVMRELCGYVDILITNEEHARMLLNVHGEDVETIARALAARYGCDKIAITRRRTVSAEITEWGAFLYDTATDKTTASEFSRIHCVDRIGSGDAFAGGLIHALRSGYTSDRALKFGAAATVLNHSIEGDFNLVSPEEVVAVADGRSDGRVQR